MTVNQIDDSRKLGIATWDKDKAGTALNNLDQINFSWYYTWNFSPLWDSDPSPENATFVPMIWDETYISTLSSVPSGVDTLLGFNEPDHLDQANLTVEEALQLWPELLSTGKRLGSPAPTTPGALGEESWLGRFMNQATALNYKVDFIAIHYYTENNDVEAFRDHLNAVYQQYGKPIWITEWCLADWNSPGRFSPQEQAEFAKAAILMMDDLPFVERHAWFSSYGGEGFSLNSEVWSANGELTPVGQVFAELMTRPIGSPTGTSGNDILNGTAHNDRIHGRGGDDWIRGKAGADTILGGSGHDLLVGGAGSDTLIGGRGKDAFVFGTRLGKGNVDWITDFNVLDDTMRLNSIVFQTLTDGELAKRAFWVGSAAHDANDRLIYDQATGDLSYDADGAGGSPGIRFAVLSSGLNLTASDFLIV